MSAKTIVEAQHFWGSTLLDTLQVHQSQPLTIGVRSRESGWHLDSPPFEQTVDCFPLVSWREGAPFVTLHSSFDGRARRGLVTESLSDWARKGESGELPGTSKTRMEIGEVVEIECRGQTFAIRVVPAAPLEPRPWSDRLNYPWINSLILVGFAHLLAVVSFLSVSRASTSMDADVFTRRSRILQTRYVSSRTPPIPKANGREKLSDVTRRSPIPRSRSRPTKQSSGIGSANELGAVFEGISQLMKGNEDGALQRALSGLKGPAVAGNGLEGGGSRGSGYELGGGRSVVLGRLETGGRGGGGDGDYGVGSGDLGKKRYHDVIWDEPIHVHGGLERELIRRVIDDNKAQIRYCYERALTSDPGLFGKIDFEWVIEASGAVQSVKTVSSTLRDESVQGCIRGKISKWRFPEPSGGGVVVVRYPFVFRSR